MSTVLPSVGVRPGDQRDLAAVDRVMAAAFEPRFGEAWSRSQCSGVLGMPGTWLMLAEDEGHAVGFTLSRVILDEAELLLIAVDPAARRRGVGQTLLDATMTDAGARGARTIHLEVRAGNPAIALYTATGFVKVGERRGYYRGRAGEVFDALSYRRILGDL